MLIFEVVRGGWGARTRTLNFLIQSQVFMLT